MLVLPENWRRMTAEAAVEKLLRQADGVARASVTAVVMVQACLELLAEEWQRKDGQKRVLERIGEDEIRLGNGLFRVLLPLEDDTLLRCGELIGCRRMVYVLTAPWSRHTAKRAFEAMGWEKHVNVLGLDEYVGMRVFLSHLDAGVSHHAYFQQLLGRYQGLAAACGDEAIMLRAFAGGSEGSDRNG